jgi:pimeloyl-ACP methyl ester carboxylesterase
MPRRFGRWMAVLVASSVAMLAPVPVLTPAAEAAEPSAPLQATVDAYVARAQTVTWEPCEGLLFQPRSSCATVVVPRDWKSPAAGTLRLAVSYLRASGTSKGLLTSNPGGPGAEGLLFTEALSRSKPKLYQDYDLLGFDPRGFGASTNINDGLPQHRGRCLTTNTKLERLPKVADRRVRNRATHSMEVAEAKLFGEACAADPLARYLNTQQTVWDVDFLRQLMAKRYNKGALYNQLNYIGYSYGTWLGAWYADTFPARVGKFVLDSNMQWTTSMYANQALDSKSFQRRRDKMFFPYVARHHRDFGLGKSTSKVKKKYESIRKSLAKQAAKDLKKGRTATFGPEDLDFVLSSLLYSNELFPAAGYITELAGDYAKKPSSSKYRKALAKRVKAPMTKAPFVVQRSASKVKGSALVSVDLAGTIVRCNDSATPGNLTQLLKRADADARKYPFTGYLNTIPLCAYWKFKPQTRTIDLTGLSTKMLMFQSEGDPATAYEGALAAHRRTAGKTVMVSVDNEGQHGLYVDGPSKCLEDIGDAFLFRGWKPTADRRCTTSPLPDDKKVYTLSGPVSGARSDAKKTIKAKNPTVKAVRADVAKRGLS